MEYNFFTWWLSTKVQPLSFKIWRYTISPINFLALTMFISVFQEYFLKYFVMMFLPIIFIDIIWDGFNFASYRRDRQAELQTISSGENLAEDKMFSDEYTSNKELLHDTAKTEEISYVPENEVLFEDEKKLESKRGILSKLKTFLTFTKDKTDNAPMISKERKREIKLIRKFNDKASKSKIKKNESVK